MRLCSGQMPQHGSHYQHHGGAGSGPTLATRGAAGGDIPSSFFLQLGTLAGAHCELCITFNLLDNAMIDAYVSRQRRMTLVF